MARGKTEPAGGCANVVPLIHPDISPEVVSFAGVISSGTSGIAHGHETTEVRNPLRIGVNPVKAPTSTRKKLVDERRYDVTAN